ncbi:hypothetical protein EBR37_04305, partial [bacterium]|nr:hypothetical protein [bacterium]
MSSQLRNIRSIYYLPGHGGRITNGLGQALMARGYEVIGRETVGDFKKLNFNDQVTTIANDIKVAFPQISRQILLSKSELEKCKCKEPNTHLSS